MILVTGSKNWRDRDKIARWFAGQSRKHEVVIENLPGASELASLVARDLGFKVTFRTTRELLSVKADLVVGFWDGKDKRAQLVLDAALAQDFERDLTVIYPHTKV